MSTIKRILMFSMPVVVAGSVIVWTNSVQADDPAEEEAFPLGTHDLLPHPGPDRHVAYGRVDPNEIIEQPIEYSHMLHAGTLQIECEYCHNNARKSIHAGVPPTETCMNCHKMVDSTDRPELEKLKGYWERGEEIPWVKVHDLPDFVYFSHKRHVRAGVDCTECHGRRQGVHDRRPARQLPEHGLVPGLPQRTSFRRRELRRAGRAAPCRDEGLLHLPQVSAAMPSSTFDRRDFLKGVGAAGAAVAATGCDYNSPVPVPRAVAWLEDPVVPYENVLPYVVQDRQIVPGNSTWFATRCDECPASCSIRAREPRRPHRARRGQHQRPADRRWHLRHGHGRHPGHLQPGPASRGP